MSPKRLIIAAGAIVAAGLLAGIVAIIYLNSTGTSEATRKLERCAQLTHAERFEEAPPVCTEAITLSPESPEPYYNRALAYLDTGRSPEARSDAEKGCSLGLAKACD